LQETIKHNILTKALKIIPFEGWSKAMMRSASESAGYPSEMAELIFPNGPISFLDFYHQDIDLKLSDEIKKLPLLEMKIREKIAAAVECRIKLIEKDKAVINKAISFSMLPTNTIVTAKFAWRTVDLIWYEAGGDKSTDFNYYTKRSLLFGVYTSTLMYWLSDDSKDWANTKEYLKRRIENVMQVGSFIGKFKSKSK